MEGRDLPVLDQEIVATALTIFVILGGPAQAATTTAHARLHQIDHSGIKGRAMLVEDATAQTVTVDATAMGMDPSVSYVSLIYDTGSVPGGPEACEPTNESLEGRMVVGFWQVDAAGHGTLHAVNFMDEDDPDPSMTSFVPVAAIGTMSIRIVDPEDLEEGELQACGNVNEAD